MEGRIEVKIRDVRKIYPFSSPAIYNLVYNELWDRLEGLQGLDNERKTVYLYIKSKRFKEKQEPQTIKEIC